MTMSEKRKGTFVKAHIISKMILGLKDLITAEHYGCTSYEDLLRFRQKQPFVKQKGTVLV